MDGWVGGWGAWVRGWRVDGKGGDVGACVWVGTMQPGGLRVAC